MQLRKPLLLIGHFFLALAFLFTPVVDNMHAIKMLGGEGIGLQGLPDSSAPELASTSPAPCHEATLASTEVSLPKPISADDRKPCCPHEQCSPDNCLMHMAMASLSSFEIFPQSPLDRRKFLLADTYPVSLPFTERLRPPIV